MSDFYFTIPREATAEIKMKGSRFIAAALPRRTVDDVEATLARLRKRYYDASHNCYAWRVGREDDLQFKYSDDGEPSGTAGKPIYDCIVGRELTDLLVVVTRYFGGTKLGTGGLVRAYSDTAIAALEKAGRVEKFITDTIRLTIDFTFYDAIRKLVVELGATEQDAQFSDHVELVLEIRQSMMPRLREAIVQATNGRALFADETKSTD